MKIVLLAKAFVFLAFGFPGLTLGTFLLFGGGPLQMELGHSEGEARTGVMMDLEFETSTAKWSDHVIHSRRFLIW